MSLYELLTIFTSLLAAIISFVSLIRTRSISKKQLELEKITANLAKKQLQLLEDAEIAKNKAYIDAELIRDGNKKHIILTNTGQADAFNINLKILSDYNPLFPSEYKEIFPIASLKPSKSVALWASTEIRAPDNYEIEVSWTDVDGTSRVEAYSVFLSRGVNK